jgi:hypothetical protein
MNNFAPFDPYLPGLGGVLAFISLLFALRSGKRKRLIDNLPTSKTTGVFIGLVELKGTAESTQPLISYLAGQPCVQYQWRVEEHWSRMVTETYTDSEGKTQTRTRHESGWKTVSEGGEVAPFYLQDDCGVILVRPEGAKIEPAKIFDETCGMSDPLYYAKGPLQAVTNSDFRRRFTETAIPLRADLYVMGQTRERQDVVAPEIAQDPGAPMFLISMRTEAQVSSSYRWVSWSLTLLGLALCVAGFVVRDKMADADRTAAITTDVLAVAAYLFAFALGWVWMVYNSLIDLRQRARQGWSQVDVQLKRRHDLIPNLIESVKGLRGYEQNIQTELAAMRAQMEATPPGVEGPDHRACGTLLLAIQERYPELKANESFLNLQKNLSDTEQRIALARGYFNEIATFYNTRLEVVPDRFVAALGGLKPQSLMVANDFERAPVEVNPVCA